ncbi:MAG: arylsulfatase [Pirellulales bacterium]
MNIARRVVPRILSTPRKLAAVAFVLVSGLSSLELAYADEPRDRPNVVIILADDLGFSDLGCYGSEIKTPSLDALACDGLRFTQFYNTARCWPTRAAILTGYYAQQVRRDTLPGLKDVPSGSRGVRPGWAKLLPERLQRQGYRSYHSGKWHLDGQRVAAGFDRSYSLEDHDRHFSPKHHLENDKPLPAIEASLGYYSSTAIADHAVDCLQEHANKHAHQPFLHYVAFTAPHFPLHAPAEDIARCRDRYGVGWQEIRRMRFLRLKSDGLLTCGLSAVEPDVGPPYHFAEALAALGPGEVNRPLPWDSLSEEQQAFQAAKMAVHAAMVERMDHEIGRIVAQLRAMRALDNTLLMFLSDNGASAEIMVRGDGHDAAAAPGSAATFLCLGPGWSNAANTPFRRHKTWVHEGGISTPLIVHWPRGCSACGELRHNPGHVVDIVPTILDAIGADDEPASELAGPAFPGQSLLPALARDGDVAHEYLWWLHEGHRAVRVGDLKLISDSLDGPWELYDLAADRQESHNLADQMPDKAAELARLWSEKLDTFRVDATASP